MESELLVTAENCARLVGKRVILILPIEQDQLANPPKMVEEEEETPEDPKATAATTGDGHCAFTSLI
jgi:hypothetical protein